MNSTETHSRTCGLSFDTCGINDADMYRTRIATFETFEYAQTYGPLFALSPDFLSASIELCSALAAMQTASDWLPGSKARRLTDARERMMSLIERATV